MTQTATLTLTDFLLARIAEDEAHGDDGKRRALGPDYDHLCRLDLPGDRLCILPAGHLGDPARVLAECAAKRRIVEEHGDQHECTSLTAGDWPYVGCTTLRLLAQPYADHGDYRQEWRV